MYALPNMDLWKGRTDSLIDKDEFRIHQIVKDNQITSINNGCGIIGFSCDEGVRRNKGRLGNKEKLPMKYVNPYLLCLGTAKQRIV